MRRFICSFMLVRRLSLRCQPVVCWAWTASKPPEPSKCSVPLSIVICGPAHLSNCFWVHLLQPCLLFPDLCCGNYRPTSFMTCLVLAKVQPEKQGLLPVLLDVLMPLTPFFLPAFLSSSPSFLLPFSPPAFLPSSRLLPLLLKGTSPHGAYIPCGDSPLQEGGTTQHMCVKETSQYGVSIPHDNCHALGTTQHMCNWCRQAG